ncbi:hypothetical protein [Mycolicibacterium moriokaense]|uniref:DUF3558 domain-containing protein n=1 Tax=Mycolicibacterium moriokaense TaxID=39691 RepID=A0A318HD48_9MYCO|nr:hypothetical protein [Mycolicibacterium moriokaense]PXX01583.1 hypothetical protein C8E89_12869 [Mycolicibacterium moriokaense]
MTTNRFWPALTGVAICLGVTACASGEPTPPTPPPAAAGTAVTTTGDVAGHPTSPVTGRGEVNACSAITQQEATAALGTDAGPGQKTTEAGVGDRCTYSAGTSSVLVNIVYAGGKAAYDHAHEVLTSTQPGALNEVTGVGDGAFGTFGGPQGTVEFYKGDTVVVVTLRIPGTSQPPKNEAITLAKIAADRI